MAYAVVTWEEKVQDREFDQKLPAGGLLRFAAMLELYHASETHFPDPALRASERAQMRDRRIDRLPKIRERLGVVCRNCRSRAQQASERSPAARAAAGIVVTSIGLVFVAASGASGLESGSAFNPADFDTGRATWH